MAMSAAFEVTSRWLVLIDPLALDLAQRALQALGGLPEARQRQRLAAASPHLRIGVHEIADFKPGRYRIDPDDLEPSTRAGPDIVDVDSGAIAFTGLDRLPALAPDRSVRPARGRNARHSASVSQRMAAARSS